MKPQHYQVGLIEAISHYQRGDLTAKGLLHFYIKIRLKAGWKLKETQKEISQKLGISRAAFYSALSKLKAEGSINWSAPVNTRFCITLNSGESINLDDESTDEDDSLSSTTVDGVSTISNNSSTVADGQSTHQDDSSTVVDSPSYIVTGEKPETILRKDLRKLSYSSP